MSKTPGNKQKTPAIIKVTKGFSKEKKELCLLVLKKLHEDVHIKLRSNN